MSESSWNVNQSLTRYANGVRNPLKGLRASFELDERYGSLSRFYIKWNAIEKTAADTVDKIRAYSLSHWNGAHLNNTKIIPRVYLAWPDVGEYWPDDLQTGDFDSPVFRERLKAMVKKMAEAWDNDPQIAYIEMGLIGMWGEQHTPSPTHEVQQVLIEAFHTYFKNKLVMVRYPASELFAQGGFGLYWDEWGSDMQWSEWDRIDMLLGDAYKDRWKTQVIGGENTNNLYTFDPDGGRFMTYGCPDPFDAETAFTKYSSEMIKYARLVHANHMHTRLDEVSSGLAKMNVATFQDTLGYAFELKAARFNHVDAQERRLSLSFDVKNTGASPFYYDWPVRVSLLDPETNKPVWSRLIPGSSVMDWMPGEEWQVQERKYAVPAQTYTVDASFALPEDVENGEYILALSIPDPAGLRNAAVFLNTGYIEGGYTALGMVGVGQEAQQTLNFSNMLIPQQDPTLRYDQNIALHDACTVPDLTDGLSSTSWVSDGSAVTIHLESKRMISSLTVQFAQEQRPFSVYVREQKEWVQMDAEFFQNRTNETHVPLNVRAVAIRIVPEEGAELTQVLIFAP